MRNKINKTKLITLIAATAVCSTAALTASMHYKYSKSRSPSSLNVSNSDEKAIVIIGSGIIGLTSAYYLS